jgi:bifunctional DNase/RNase
MDVQMELARIVISELSQEQYIFLREKNGVRAFPIVIGITEAMAIDRRLKGYVTPRPMTHDLLAGVIEQLGGVVEKVVINDLRRLDPDEPGQTFIATIHVTQNGKDIEIDSRPSDAIALGVAMGTPIYVAEHVLETVLKEPSTLEAKLELLRQRQSMLASRIAEINERLEDEEFVSQAPRELVDDLRGELAQHEQEYEAIDRVLKKIQ